MTKYDFMCLVGLNDNVEFIFPNSKKKNQYYII